MPDTLLLNADYSPITVISWQHGIKLVLAEKVRLVESWKGVLVRSPSLQLEAPAVIVLKDYVSYRHKVSFTRHNVFARDNWTCQYCGKRAGLRDELRVDDLTFDHVYPASKGGETSWENIVTSCGPCNVKKKAQTPKQAGMSLLSKPKRPNRVDHISAKMSGKQAPQCWRPYLAKR